MAEPTEGGRILCAEEPALAAFDMDGDGVLSFEELRAQLSNNPQVVQIVTKLEERGVAGIRYAGCKDVADESSVASNGASEDLAKLIARAAVNNIYESDR